CRDARQWGKICAHSLALGVAIIRSRIPARKEAPRTAELLPVLLDAAERSVPGADFSLIELHIVFAPNMESAWERGDLTIGFEVLPRGNRQLASALDPKQTFACSRIDLDVLTKTRSLLGQMPGIAILDQGRFLKVAAWLTDHPRVTIARKSPVTISKESLLPTLQVEQLEDRRWQIRADALGLKGKLFIGPESVWIWTGQRL